MASKRSRGDSARAKESVMDIDADARTLRSEVPAESWSELSGPDKQNTLVLIVLYFLQGAPMGLISGSLPFVLKDHLSYSDLAALSLAAYPYSLKLLWSPIVDAVYWPALGRRKSWIIPAQILLLLLLWYASFQVERIIEEKSLDITSFATLMFTVIFMAATQDIAVDGWALTLLSKANLSWASTCQSIGLQVGFFTSYTIFLALNSAEFCSEYLFATPQAHGVLEAGTFMRAIAGAILVVTLWLLLFKKEERFVDLTGETNIRQAYSQMMQVLRLPSVQMLALVMLVHKFGFTAGDALSPLKIIEKGFRKDRLAVAAVIDFPIQIYLGFMAARWTQGAQPLRAFLWATAARLAMSLIGMGVVYGYPTDGDDFWYFPIVIAASVASSFCSTVMFVCIGAFFARISDPVIGGTYLTLLNTLSNFGGTWPKWIALQAVQWTTTKGCSDGSVCSTSSDCSTGECMVLVDGYYVVMTFFVSIGALAMWTIVWPLTTKIQGLPERAWRIGQK